MSTRPAPSLPRADRLLPRPRARERVLGDDPDELTDAPEPASPEPTELEGAEGPEAAAGAANPQVSQ
jgi:hypothetical protein